MDSWSQHAVGVNELHRTVFGFSDDVITSLAAPPRPPAPRSAPRPPASRPQRTQGPTQTQPVRATGGLASAKRLVFTRTPCPGGAPPANQPVARGRGSGSSRPRLPFGGAAPRYTRRGSGSTKTPSSGAASSASFLSSSQATTDSVVDPDEVDGCGLLPAEPDSDEARLASTNRYYHRISAALSIDADSENDSPPPITGTGDRHGCRCNSGHVAQAQPPQGARAPSVRSTPTVAPPTHSHAPNRRSSPQYVPSPWKLATGVGGTAGSPSPPMAFAADTFSHDDSAHTTRQTLLHWTAAAGIGLQPPAAYADLSAQAADDLRVCEAAWRRLCAKGRVIMGRYGDHVATLRDRRRSMPSGRNSLLGLSSSRTGAGTAANRFADPTHSQLGKQTAPGSGSVMSLRAFRHQQSYGRWCQWQLNRFFERGPAYLGSVWRHRECGTIASISHLIDGQYSVPTGNDITRDVAALRAEERKANLLRQLLLREQGVFGTGDETQTGVCSQVRSPEREGEVRDTIPRDASPDVPEQEEDGTNNVSEGDKAAYADVRFDSETGLLNVSVYVDAPDSDETGTFLHAFVAGCLDGLRWLVLTGPWKRQIMFFQPAREKPVVFAAPAPQCASTAQLHADTQTHVSAMAAESSAPSETLHPISGFHSFCLHGVVFRRDRHNATSGPQDPFVCTRCGNVRAHNPIYISRAGGLARGQYRCWICRRRTPHIRVPPSYLLALRTIAAQLSSGLTSSARTGMPQAQTATPREDAPSVVADPFRRTPQPPSAPRMTVSAKLRYLNARSQSTGGPSNQGQRPARWNGSVHVNEDILLGRVRPLSAAPLKPTA